jgi:site-specific recombinase XerC
MREGTIRDRKGRVYKPSTVRKYEENLRLLIVPRISAVPVATLTGGDCERLVDEIAAERTPEHARRALTALRVALRICQIYGELDTNPCMGVRVPANGDGEKPARILSPEEAEQIIAQAEADDTRLGRSFAGPLCTLAFGSGLRLGEMLALVHGPDGLDLDSCSVNVTRSLDRVRDKATGNYPFVAPKSKAGLRTVPLAPEDVAALRTQSGGATTRSLRRRSCRASVRRRAPRRSRGSRRPAEPVQATAGRSEWDRIGTSPIRRWKHPANARLITALSRRRHGFESVCAFLSHKVRPFWL